MGKTKTPLTKQQVAESAANAFTSVKELLSWTLGFFAIFSEEMSFQKCLPNEKLQEGRGKVCKSI